MNPIYCACPSQWSWSHIDSTNLVFEQNIMIHASGKMCVVIQLDILDATVITTKLPCIYELMLVPSLELRCYVKVSLNPAKPK